MYDIFEQQQQSRVLVTAAYSSQTLERSHARYISNPGSPVFCEVPQCSHDEVTRKVNRSYCGSGKKPE